MSSNPLDAAGPILTNTMPATIPNQEPIMGKYCTLKRLTEEHLPDLWTNIGSHPSLWTWWPEGPYSTFEEFSTEIPKLLTLMGEDRSRLLCRPQLRTTRRGSSWAGACVLQRSAEQSRRRDWDVFRTVACKEPERARRRFICWRNACLRVIIGGCSGRLMC